MIGGKLQGLRIGVFSLVCAMAAPAMAQRPWMDTHLSPDQRADLVLREMTLDEKIDLMHRQGMPGWSRPMPRTYLGNGGAGFIIGVPRLGIPQVEMSDAAYGVRMSAQKRTVLHRAAGKHRRGGQLGP
jgi:beta-glucosidase